MSDPSPAATVVILRETGGVPELLLTERHGKLGFAGGAMVFPGGKVDPGDLAIARDAALARGFDALDDSDAAARIAAAREAFEEVGVDLSDGAALDAGTVDEWRARFAAVADAEESATYAAFLAATGRRADAARLTPFAHWVPPAGIHRRFDTLFYIAVAAPGTDARADGSEAVSAHWLTAAAACADPGVNLIFPTRRNLERLAQYDSIAALLATLTKAPTRIVPCVVEHDGARWLTIPAGCDYPVIEERLESAMRG